MQLFYHFIINQYLCLSTTIRNGHGMGALGVTLVPNMAIEWILFEYYTLRFQIELDFRDAKRYWGSDNFMNVKEEAVTNAAGLSFFLYGSFHFAPVSTS